MRNYGIRDVHSWKFDHINLPAEWQKHLGNLPENFRMLIQGPSGHGKTEYLMQLTKMFALAGYKVSLNNVEQGRSASLQEAVIRNNMDEVPGGKWMLADGKQRTFEPWFKKLQRPNSGRIIALDSLDYMKLTLDDFKVLHERFPYKSIIIVCWDDPMDIHAKKIKYMCDVKVRVRDYKARIMSRFGGNEPWVIWKKQLNGQRQLF
jgi:hypothetical protein